MKYIKMIFASLVLATMVLSAFPAHAETQPKTTQKEKKPKKATKKKATTKKSKKTATKKKPAADKSSVAPKNELNVYAAPPKAEKKSAKKKTTKAKKPKVTKIKDPKEAEDILKSLDLEDFLDGPKEKTEQQDNVVNVFADDQNTTETTVPKQQQLAVQYQGIFSWVPFLKKLFMLQ